MKRPYPEDGVEIIRWADSLVERVEDDNTSEEEVFDFVCTTVALFRDLRASAPAALDAAVAKASASMRAAELMYAKMQMRGGAK